LLPKGPPIFHAEKGSPFSMLGGFPLPLGKRGKRDTLFKNPSAGGASAFWLPLYFYFIRISHLPCFHLASVLFAQSEKEF